MAGLKDGLSTHFEGGIMAYCTDCGETLPLDNPNWRTRCWSCYRKFKADEAQPGEVVRLRKEVSALRSMVNGWKEYDDARDRKIEEWRKYAEELERHTFTLEQLKSLRRLVHPDRHNQSSISNEISKLVNEKIRLAE
jgi:hypothetical protein